ncbi:MAG: nucleotidyltransferase [Clostridia bacterium]|jgi:predicted nucleotidyltransferase
MKVLGLITEYNPFHNGHLYHLEESKRITGADYTVCVMSGNFVQRGEPAIINKWARARAALINGADLVIELPFVFAASSAESFAYASVMLLDSLGIVDTICFGSESGNLESLKEIAEILVREPEVYKSLLKKFMACGLNFPQARELALNEYLKSIAYDVTDFKEIIGNSNNILAIEYLKALVKLNSSITPRTLKRISNAYSDSDLSGIISSATAIRNEIFSSANALNSMALKQSVPPDSLSVLKDEFKNGRGPVSLESFDNIILSALRRMSYAEIKEVPNVTEGLENRIMKAAETSGTLNNLIDSVCTKRYTKTRIQRILINVLGGVTKNDHKIFLKSNGPKYIRILGFTNKGQDLLNAMKKSAKLPVIMKTSDYVKSDNPHIKRMLQIEAFSTDQYVLGYQNPEFRTSGQEFTQKIVKI